MNIANIRALKASRFRLRRERNALVERLRAPYHPRETEQLWTDLRGVCEQLASMDERLASAELVAPSLLNIPRRGQS